MNDQTRLHDLIELAREPSSQRRRELLRSLTDVFFSHEGHGVAEMDLFDEVLTQLAGEMEAAVRAELAERMAGGETAPARLMSALALDEIDIARPVLAAGALSEADLLQVARTKGQDHLRALSERQDLTSVISDAIVDRGDDQTLGVLLRNEAAELSRRAHERAVDRASANPELHEAVVQRQSLPLDLLNEMYFVVEARLREDILARNDAVDPGVLEAALEAGRKRLAAQEGVLPPDYAEAEAYVRALRKREAISPRTLAAMLRNRETTRFLVALSELADIDFHTARRILERRELDALAIVCKAADFDRALFLTFAVLILDRDDDAMGRAKAYGELYAELPKESAERTIRFWRMRRRTGDVAAA